MVANQTNYNINKHFHYMQLYNVTGFGTVKNEIPFNVNKQHRNIMM